MKIKFVEAIGGYKTLWNEYPEMFRPSITTITFGKTYFTPTKEDIGLSYKVTDEILGNVEESLKKPMRNLFKEAFPAIRKHKELELYCLGENSVYTCEVLEKLYTYFFNYCYKNDINLSIFSQYTKPILWITHFTNQVKSKNIDVDIYVRSKIKGENYV